MIPPDPLPPSDPMIPRVNRQAHGAKRTSGNITDEVISKYIESQDVEPQDDDGFKVTE
jgi:hypothetical protein